MQDGPLQKEPPNGIKCLVHCGDERLLEWFYDKGENSSETKNYDNFNSFVSNKLSGDRRCMKIYRVKNGDELVEDEGDFGLCFDDIDVGSGKQVDFRVEVSGYVINVDLKVADCKEDFQFTLPKSDLKDETEWMESWQELLTRIGNTLKNSKWEEKFLLLNKENDSIINKKLEDFIDVFGNGETKSNAYFYLQVEQ